MYFPRYFQPVMYPETKRMKRYWERVYDSMFTVKSNQPINQPIGKHGHHKHVSTLGGIQSGLEQGFPAVSGVLLIGLFIAKPRV